jgi:hypothetical protein
MKITGGGLNPNHRSPSLIAPDLTLGPYRFRSKSRCRRNRLSLYSDVHCISMKRKRQVSSPSCNQASRSIPTSPFGQSVLSLRAELQSGGQDFMPLLRVMSGWSRIHLVALANRARSKHRIRRQVWVRITPCSPHVECLHRD